MVIRNIFCIALHQLACNEHIYTSDSLPQPYIWKRIIFQVNNNQIHPHCGSMHYHTSLFIKILGYGRNSIKIVHVKFVVAKSRRANESAFCIYRSRNIYNMILHVVGKHFLNLKKVCNHSFFLRLVGRGYLIHNQLGITIDHQLFCTQSKCNPQPN